MDTDIWRRSATGLLDGADILQEVHAETPKDRSVCVRQKNGGFYDGRYRNPLILSHFRNRPTGFKAF